jgi:hypothetical protein
MHQDVYEELKKVARSKNVTNYTAIGNMIGLDMGNPGDRNKIAKILDEINYHEHQHGRPMISAVVIRQDINMPREGFLEGTERGRGVTQKGRVRSCLLFLYVGIE